MQQVPWLDEIQHRRTFAIISHPDAGKTTMTEKLLLYGGAIRMAGSVKARKAQRHAVSDWMEIEKQRGISVTSSVMQFGYNGFRINILDTPGHQDFSEDTYRTLVAADSAVMLIDGSRGVETQTIKLFHVCRMRGIPIFTFVNKMDRASKDPFSLMEEIEQVLGIRTSPINWPIGIHGDFQGVYHRDTGMVELYRGGDHGQRQAEALRYHLDDPQLAAVLDASYISQLREEIELLDMAGDPLELEQVSKGELSPMFFGSAMNNFGVEPFLERFLDMTAPPLPRDSSIGLIQPQREDFSGFVFKIQANMNPAHRDRLAFMRICSGMFERGMTVRHVDAGKDIRLMQPQQFMADEHQMVDVAYPGDIIGLFDPGIFHLGDTLVTGEEFQFDGIPMFAPEHFARVSTLDSMKRKQFIKGIMQLSEEGAIQTFKQLDIGREELIVGVVGVLQFEVLEHRLKNEYGVDVRRENLGFKYVRWVVESPVDVEKLSLTSSTRIARDRAERLVLLFENDWSVRWAEDNNKGLVLTDVAKRTDLRE